jgi:hypothetical protein
MNLSEFTKESKGLLEHKDKESSKENGLKEIKVGRPKIEDSESKLDKKITININSYEKEFLENLNRETGIPISTYLRKKLLEVEAFKK